MDTSPSPYDAPHYKLFTVCAKSLINILNSNGDKMQPCFNPILTSNQSLICPLILTAHLTSLYKDFSASSILPEIPSLINLPQ